VRSRGLKSGKNAASRGRGPQVRTR
jgi:hypothetical protein